MLKKRLIGVITIKNGWAVQSFGFNRYLPIGKPEIVAENLDRWGADEILLLEIDRSSTGSKASIAGLGPNFPLLNRIVALGIATPITYAGGIRNELDAVEVIKCGAERIAIDFLFHDNSDLAQKIAEQVGTQAVIASLPLSAETEEVLWYNYAAKTYAPFSSRLEKIAKLFKDRFVSEALVIDHMHEGYRDSFNMKILENCPLPSSVPLICFGGISEPTQVEAILKLSNVVAVGIGNSLNYSEHAIQKIKAGFSGTALRSATYE